MESTTFPDRYRDSPHPDRSHIASPPPPGLRQCAGVVRPKPLETRTLSPGAMLDSPLDDCPPEPYRDDPEPQHTLGIEHQRSSEQDIMASEFAPPSPNPPFDCPPYLDQVIGENEDVPLASLYPYPTEAPPAYAVAVRQSYRDTLISHIPSYSQHSNATATASAFDEEAGISESLESEDVRYTVERTVAQIVVMVALLGVCAVFIWQLLSMRGLL